MTKYQVGDIVQATNFSSSWVTKITSINDEGMVKFEKWANGLAGVHYWDPDTKVTRLIKRSVMEQIKVGDKALRDRKEVEVVLVSDDYIITKDTYDGTNDLEAYTTEEFFKVHELVDKVTELTLEQIAEKFGIDTENLRIKE